MDTQVITFLLWAIPVSAASSLTTALCADQKNEDWAIAAAVWFIAQIICWVGLLGYFLGHP
jgi:hypothetical protein